MLIAALLAFASGAIYEIGCTFWLHHASSNHPFRTAAWSMLNATCQVAGIGSSVAHPVVAPAFVLGYGFGSALGVVLTHRRHTQAGRDPTP